MEPVYVLVVLAGTCVRPVATRLHAIGWADLVMHGVHNFRGAVRRGIHVLTTDGEPDVRGLLLNAGVPSLSLLMYVLHRSDARPPDALLADGYIPVSVGRGTADDVAGAAARIRQMSVGW